MTAFRSCGYWLLLFPLLSGLGCGDKKGGQLTAQPVTVTITAECKVGPDPTVAVGQSLIWKPPDLIHKYSANFAQSKTPFYFSSAYVAPAGLPGKTVTGDLSCNLSLFSPKYCYFRYDVYKDDKKCGDPGVHVGPPSPFSFLKKLWK